MPPVYGAAGVFQWTFAEHHLLTPSLREAFKTGKWLDYPLQQSFKGDLFATLQRIPSLLFVALTTPGINCALGSYHGINKRSILWLENKLL